MSARIKEARLARNWSQQELADRVRVSQPTIVHWEQGTHTPRHLALSRLADTLGVSRQWLLGESRSSQPTESARFPVPSQHGASQTDHDSSAAVTGLLRPMAPAPMASHPGKGSVRLPSIAFVGVHGWPTTPARLDAILAGLVPPEDHLPISRMMSEPVALHFADDTMRATFPSGTILVADLANHTLEDGSYHLFEQGGRVVARRWRESPGRMEADTLADTVFSVGVPQSLGRILCALRHL
jgi:Helix-turn-helix